MKPTLSIVETNVKQGEEPTTTRLGVPTTMVDEKEVMGEIQVELMIKDVGVVDGM